MTPRYPIPADAIPGLLDAWEGPCEMDILGVWVSATLLGLTNPDGSLEATVSRRAGRWTVGTGLTRPPSHIRLDPARPEVAHLLEDRLRSLGHEVRALLPRALGGEQGETVEETACAACGGDGYYKGPRLGDEPCPMCSGTGKLRRTVLASEVSAALLAASVAGVVAGRGVVRGLRGEWQNEGRLWWRPILVGRGHESALVLDAEGRSASDTVDLAEGWARLDTSAPSGVVVPTWEVTS